MFLLQAVNVVEFVVTTGNQIINICDFTENDHVTLGAALYVHSPGFPGQYEAQLECKTYFNRNMTSQYTYVRH